MVEDLWLLLGLRNSFSKCFFQSLSHSRVAISAGVSLEGIAGDILFDRGLGDDLLHGHDGGVALRWRWSAWRYELVIIGDYSTVSEDLISGYTLRARQDSNLHTFQLRVRDDLEDRDDTRAQSVRCCVD